MTPKTPEEMLDFIREAARNEIVFASDTVASAYDDEIQRIYRMLREVEGKPPPKRDLWVSDDIRIDIVLFVEGDEARRVAIEAGRRLGVPLEATDLWVDAAARLRDHEGQAPRS